MKIAIIHGPFCLGNGANGFEFARLWVDPRGLSGSDLGVFRMAQELAALGHDVHIFTFPKPGTDVPPMFSPGVSLWHYDRRTDVIDESFNAAVSWNEAEPLRVLAHLPKLLRVVSLQINTIVGPAGFDFVDVWASPSESHKRMILGESNERVHRTGDFYNPTPYKPDPAQWVVIPDGCDVTVFDQLAKRGVVKQPGRVVWTSSPDRGLHWLLSCWPKIRKAVPYAHLRIFYRLKPWLDHMLNQSAEEFDPSISEQMARAHYVTEVLPRLEGIELYDSVCRRDISREQAEAEVSPYSCDPPGVWTEGFSCSLMEACAARSCPISTAVDALPEIYSGIVPLIPMPLSEHIDVFADQVIRCLTDEQYRAEINHKARKLAERFTWALAARKMADVISTRTKSS